MNFRVLDKSKTPYYLLEEYQQKENIYGSIPQWLELFFCLGKP